MGAAAIPVLITAAATAYSAYSSVQAGKAQEKAADKAEDRARKAAGLSAADTEKQHRRIIASQEALYGASGLTQEGSPLLVQQEALSESKEQLRRILEGGDYSADIYKQAGDEAIMAGNAGAIKSLLSGAGSVYNVASSNKPEANTYNWW
jgi:vacuolar-type H+-ATPase subunit E/Vma4